MNILKFGGSSVGTPENIKKVISIVKDSLSNKELPLIVVSAFQGVTNTLLELGESAARGDLKYKKIIENIEETHLCFVDQLLDEKNTWEFAREFKYLIGELTSLVYGINLLRELSGKSKDHLLSFGEVLSAKIIARSFCSNGINAEYLDAREVVITDNSFGNAAVDMDITQTLVCSSLKLKKHLQVVPGFIACSLDGSTTTLGRGGSDYTAAILGSALNAKTIQIWTDVNGFLSADPKKVSKTISVDELTYEEALEMTNFGARVVYPPTIYPAYLNSIPIIVKNTFNPSFNGTVITSYGSTKNYLVTGITALSDTTLIKIKGRGQANTANLLGRVLTSIGKKDIKVLLVSQSSTANSICFCVADKDAETVKEIIEHVLEIELIKKLIKISINSDVSIVTTIGENIQKNSAIPGLIFHALGKNGISILAIAQDSSRINISFVVPREDEIKALNVIHDEFFLSEYKTINLFVAGTGLIGRTLFQQIKNQISFLHNELKLEIKLIGLINSRMMHFDPRGIDIFSWEDIIYQKGNSGDFNIFIERMKKENLSNSIFVDCTSSEAVVERYLDILANSISIVTPNKKANSSSHEYYTELRETAKKYDVRFLYETNVGAGLPIINTLHDLILSGDKILRIEGILSGTLSYLFNNLTENRSFSDLLLIAHEKGYTEPDPRDDLNGFDIARKLLILIRESGYKMELNEIEVESLVPEKFRTNIDVGEFFKALKDYNEYFTNRYISAKKNGSVLRYVASYQDGKAEVKLREIDPSHPFFHASSNDNIVLFKTSYYDERPLVIQGPGAGARVTSGGVLSDIIRIINY
jgi:bifunctional aspartokinase / homoserine dehydrogenase 1